MPATMTLPELQRWEDHGAGWTVLELGEQQVVLELCTCHGEPVERRASRDQAVIDYVRGRRGEA